MNAHPTDEAHELAVLLDVARSVASTLELGPLLRLILDQLKHVADYSGAGIWMLDDEHLCLLEARGATAEQRETDAIGQRLPVARVGIIWETLCRDQPVIITDVRGDGDLALAYRTAVNNNLDVPEIRYVRSFLGVPLVYRDHTIGLISLSKSEPGYYTPRHVRVAAAIATHAAAAITHARLYEHERAAQSALARHVERLTTLAGITQQLLGATELDQVLRVVVESAHRLCDAGGAIVSLLDPDRRTLRAVAFAGPLADMFAHLSTGRPVDAAYLTESVTGRALATRTAVVVEDYATWPGFSRVRDRTIAAGVRALAAVPLRISGESTGVLWVADPAPRSFAAGDIALLEALADQAALAIEHARLVARGQQAAVIEERARLARDLHDSVTQSIFSVGMLARAARTQHERGSDRLGTTLDRIGVLAQEALIEMRTLLVELQPATLTDEGLRTALERLVASMRVRTDLELRFEALSDARLRPEEELAIFRIAQEALANAVKHARATRVTVTLAEAGGRLVARVADNGVGFRAGQPTPASAGGEGGGLGLRSMRERASATGLALDVVSAPGEGTTVTVTAPRIAGPAG